ADVAHELDHVAAPLAPEAIDPAVAAVRIEHREAAGAAVERARPAPLGRAAAAAELDVRLDHRRQAQPPLHLGDAVGDRWSRAHPRASGNGTTPWYTASGWLQTVCPQPLQPRPGSIAARQDPGGLSTSIVTVGPIIPPPAASRRAAGRRGGGPPPAWSPGSCIRRARSRWSAD